MLVQYCSLFYMKYASGTRPTSCCRAEQVEDVWRFKRRYRPICTFSYLFELLFILAIQFPMPVLFFLLLKLRKHISLCDSNIFETVLVYLFASIF